MDTVIWEIPFDCERRAQADRESWVHRKPQNRLLCPVAVVRSKESLSRPPRFHNTREDEIPISVASVVPGADVVPLQDVNNRPGEIMRSLTFSRPM